MNFYRVNNSIGNQSYYMALLRLIHDVDVDKWNIQRVPFYTLCNNENQRDLKNVSKSLTVQKKKKQNIIYTVI